MKKLFFLLALVPMLSFAQKDDEQNDIVNRKLLEFYESQEIFNYQAREIMETAADKILLQTKDTLLISKTKKYKEYLKTIKTVEGKEINLDNASKKDLSNFKIENDKFDNTTNINHKRGWDKLLKLSILIKDNKSMLIFRVVYNAKEWLFMKYMTVLIDGEKLDFNFKKTERDVYLGGIKEYCGFFVDEDLYNKINKIANSANELDVRFVGDEGNDDLTITKDNILKLKEVLDLYKKILVN